MGGGGGGGGVGGGGGIGSQYNCIHFYYCEHV